MRTSILFALLGTALALGLNEGEIGKTKGKGAAAAAPPPMAGMTVPSGAIQIDIDTKINTNGEIQTMNNMASAMSALPAALKEDALVAQNPAPQVMSTVSVNIGGANNAAATPGAPATGGQPSVVAGQGTTGSGQACSCECLCGSGSFPASAGVGAFGGFLGTMPAGVMASMSPAGTSLPAAAGMRAMMAKRW